MIKPFFLLSGISTLALALANPALSQTNDTGSGVQSSEFFMEDIVVTSLRRQQNLSDIPRSITLIDSEDLAQQINLGKDFDDLLGQLVPGLATSVQGRLNGTGQNQIRGRRLQLIVNGVVQNNGFLDFSEEFISFEPLNVDRIEIVRGGSAVYGFGAAGGIISVTTKRPSEEPVFNTRVSTSFQEADIDDSFAYNLYQDASFRVGEVGVRIGGTYSRRNNTFDGNNNRRPSDFNLDDTKDFSVFGSLDYQVNDNHRLLLDFNYFELEEHQRFLSTGGNAVDNIPAQGTVEVPVGISNTAILDRLPLNQDIQPEQRRNQQYQLQYDIADIAGSSVNVTAYYLNRFSPSDFLLFNTGVPVSERPIGRNEGSLERFGGRLTVNTPLALSNGNVLWGVDYENSDYEQPNTAGLRDLTPPIRQDAIAGFLQLDLELAERMRFSGGIRYEDITVDINNFTVSEAFRAPNAGNQVAGGSVSFSEAIFNAGLVFDVTENVHLFADFSQGFTTGEILRAIRNTAATSVETAVELQPQIIDNYEIGVRGTVLDGMLDYTLAGFYSQSELGVTFVFDPDTSLSNVQRAPEEVYGVEATIDVRPSEKINFGGLFAWQEGDLERSDGTTEPLPNQRIAPVKVTGYIGVIPQEGLDLRLQGVFTGSRDEFPGSGGFGEGDISSQFLLDFSAGFDVGSGRFVLGVTNLLDDQFIPPTLEGLNRNDRFFAGAGRTVNLTYTVSW